MKAELLSAADARWESFLATTPHDFYHLPAYVTLCANQDDGEAAAILVSTDENALMLPLVIREVPGGGVDATSPYGYPGPITAGGGGEEFALRALEAGIEILADRGVISLFVRGHPLLGAIPAGVGEVARGGDTVSVDLTRSTEEHWRETMSGHRNQINRALKSGRRVMFDETWANFDAFKRLYQRTMERVSADDFYFFDGTYFDGLRTALGDRLHLCLVEADGVVATAGLFVETCGIVQFHLAGSDQDHFSEGLTKVMLHFVRAWAKERGDTVFHLGGGLGQPDDALLRFKSGFSPRRHRYETLRVVIDRVEYDRLAQYHVSGVSGPVRSGYFPAYRAPVAERA